MKKILFQNLLQCVSKLHCTIILYIKSFLIFLKQISFLKLRVFKYITVFIKHIEWYLVSKMCTIKIFQLSKFQILCSQPSSDRCGQSTRYYIDTFWRIIFSNRKFTGSQSLQHFKFKKTLKQCFLKRKMFRYKIVVSPFSDECFRLLPHLHDDRWFWNNFISFRSVSVCIRHNEPVFTC